MENPNSCTQRRCEQQEAGLGRKFKSARMLKRQSSYIGDCMAQVNAETNSEIQKENVIRADSLRRGDTVLLHTHNSVYQFLVSDQKLSSGSLAGGVLGDQSVVASLVGTIFKNCVDFDSWEIRPGAAA